MSRSRLFMDDYTLFVVVDRPHADQLEVTYPTWRRNKPDLEERKLVVVCDAAAMSVEAWVRRLSFLDREYDLLIFEGDPGLSQRERMLLAWLVMPPRHCETPFYLKIDTDMVADEPGAWMPPEALDPEYNPQIMAFPWGYTRPADAIAKLDEWLHETQPGAASVATMGRIKDHHRGAKFIAKRIISRVALVNTEFAGVVADLVTRSLPPFVSHDTVLWHYAMAIGRPMFQRHKWNGWSSRLTLRGMRQAAEAVLT